jgi:phospholipid/cholesterol/gamma-HCH transport system substrate-binding protein
MLASLPPGTVAIDAALYCRAPQDSPLNVRGVRTIPCETVPGKRAPTVHMCESDEQYVPLTDDFTGKGDPDATLPDQGIPQYAPGFDPGLPPRIKTWQSMLVPGGQ